MRATLITRGKLRHEDYSYFPPRDSDLWWLAYDDYTNFNTDSESLLLESHAGRWHLYGMGVPSSRRDSTGTAVRYAWALDGECGSDVDVRQGYDFLRLWCDPAARGALGDGLDEWATEVVVHEWYQSKGSLPTGENVKRALNQAVGLALDKISRGSVSERTLPSTTTWGGRPGGTRAGGLYARGGVDELLDCAAALLRGDISGVALVLNLVEVSPQIPLSSDLAAIVARRGSHALLLAAASQEPVGQVEVATPMPPEVGAGPKGHIDRSLAWERRPDAVLMTGTPSVSRRTVLVIFCAVVCLSALVAFLLI